jgi:hypothetical protein
MRSALVIAALLAATAHAGPLADAIKREATDKVTSDVLPSPTSEMLERALRLYDRMRFAEALPALRKVLDKESGETEFNRQRATFFVGKTLFNLKRYREALTTFDSIAERGEPHPYCRKTMVWLFALSRYMEPGPHSPVAAAMARYPDGFLLDMVVPDDEANTKVLREEVRDELLYGIGLWCRAHGQAPRADKLWAAIAPKSPWAAKAKALQPASK